MTCLVMVQMATPTWAQSPQSGQDATKSSVVANEPESPPPSLNPNREEASSQEAPSQEPPSQESVPDAQETEDDLQELSLSEVQNESVSIRYKVEKVEFIGNTKTKDSVLRRYLPFKKGSTIDSEGDALSTLELRLRATGWFKAVKVRLKRGTKPGLVSILVFLQERLTVSISQLAFGVSEGLNDSSDRAEPSAYLGVEVQDNNLFGTGTRLGLGLLLSSRQQGGKIWFEIPRLVRGTSFDAEFHLANSRQFFGQDPLVSVDCLGLIECPRELTAVNAVVSYLRGGVSLGASRTFRNNFHWRLQWRGDVVDTNSVPRAASERRGTEVRPIDFAIDRGASFVSLLRFAWDYDVRNDPALPTRGTFVRLQVDASTKILGSTYDFLRFQILARRWVKLPPRHSLRFSGFLGLTIGDTPFFHKFHSSDLSDLIPSRFMEMQLDNRAPPNFLGTAIEGRRAESFGARADVEYSYTFYSGQKFLRSLRGYLNFGVYAVSSLQDLRVAVPGLEGGRGIPIDLTMDAGLRFDTSIGIFQLGLSNFLGFITL